MRIGARRGEPHTLRDGVLVLCLVGLASCSPSPRVWGDLEIVSDDPGGFRSIRVPHLPSQDSEYSLVLTCWLTPGLGAQYGLEIAYKGSDYQRVFARTFGEHNVDVQVGNESETETWTSMDLEELRERYAPSFRSDPLLGSAVYRMVLEEPAVLGVTIHSDESSVIDSDPIGAGVILFHGEFATKGIGQVFESLHSSVRKSIRNKGHFPSDEAATKLIWLALRHITAKWKNPPIAWAAARVQFAIQFGDRFRLAD